MSGASNNKNLKSCMLVSFKVIAINRAASMSENFKVNCLGVCSVAAVNGCSIHIMMNSGSLILDINAIGDFSLQGVLTNNRVDKIRPK